MTNIISIVFISDNSYLLTTVVAIRSLMKSANEENIYHIYVICNNLNIEEWENKYLKQHRQNFFFHIINYGDMIDGLSYSHNYVSKAALLKFKLADILEDLDKVLYLDGDILVYDDLYELYKTELNDLYAAVVKDMSVTIGGHLEKIGLENYFNSGVMLLNLKELRKNKVGEELFKYKEQEENAIFMDQDTFNVVFQDKVKFLPYKYNFIQDNLIKYDRMTIADFYDIKENEVDSPIILHMAGARKPWKDIESEQFVEWFSFLKDNYEMALCIKKYYEHHMSLLDVSNRLVDENIEIRKRMSEMQEGMHNIQKETHEVQEGMHNIQKETHEIQEGMHNIQKEKHEIQEGMHNIQKETHEIQEGMHNIQQEMHYNISELYKKIELLEMSFWKRAKIKIKNLLHLQ